LDSFEAVVAAILQRKGYWTQTCVKVELTKEEKREIGRHSAPRWELDVVGYRGSSNELLVVECKSFLDSPGVKAATFDGDDLVDQKRYKLFFEPTLRRVVLRRLSRQFVKAGYCAAGPKVRLALAAGRINGDEESLKRRLWVNRWELWGPSVLRKELHALRDSGYENSVATVVAKLILRGSLDSVPNNFLKRAKKE
jgi:hypothetical protein